MKIPKEIAEKVFEYESHKKTADSLFEEIEKWFEGNVCDGCYQNEYSITTKPEGIPQSDGGTAVRDSMAYVKIRLRVLIIIQLKIAIVFLQMKMLRIMLLQIIFVKELHKK